MSETGYDILLSPPHLSETEGQLVAEAIASNWIAPVGPHVEAFEQEFAATVGSAAAVALSSGTAALHLALAGVGVGPGDDVLVSTLTFVGSVNPIRYLGATPIFVDSEPMSWNLDPGLVEEAIERGVRRKRAPRAVVAVHLYGQPADLDPLVAICRRYGITLIEDAAEALGATYRGAQVGTIGRVGIYSFNGNKVITTSGGGMLVSDEPALVARVRKLANQSREPAPHYEHCELGYNYRLSNLLSAVGRGQLGVLADRVHARRRNFDRYATRLRGVQGIDLMPEVNWGRHSRWLTTLTIAPGVFGADREQVRLALGRRRIEARPVWKPMHQQPLFRGCEAVGGAIADRLFDQGLCLPSGSNLGEADIDRVVEAFLEARN